MTNIVSTCLRFFFYLTVTFQWLWAFIVFLPAIMSSGFFDLFVAPDKPAPSPVVPTAPVVAEPLAVFFGSLVTIAVLAMTIVMFIRMPKTVANTGDKTIKKAATKIVPAITHKKKLTKKKQLQLTERAVYIIQLSLIASPLLLVVIIGLWVPSPVSQDIALATGSFLAIWPLVWLTADRALPSPPAKKTG